MHRHRNNIGGNPIVIAYICCLCIGLVALAGCGTSKPEDKTADSPVSREFFAMDTYMTVSAYGSGAEEATKRAESEVLRLEKMLSATREDSEIYLLNKQGNGRVSTETGELIERSMEIYRQTDGAFNIAVYPIVCAWGFTGEDHRIPSDDELEDLLELARIRDVSIDRSGDGEVKVKLEKKEMAIGLGGIAKGYASSRIMDVFRECGVSGGIANLGGNVQVMGSKPDGSRWRIAIQDPAMPESKSSDDLTGDDEPNGKEYIGVLEGENKAVITSGPYERYFVKDGRVYHHIIDPTTGKPADNGLKSVSVVSEDGAMADALATSLYIMGREKATEYWKENGDKFDFIILDEKDRIYITEGIADDFSSEKYQVTEVSSGS